MGKNKKTGRVYLIGAGPGDPDLITRRGYAVLMQGEAVVYDNLVPAELIAGLPEHVERIYVGKKAGKHTLPQDRINELLVQLARQGKKVIRLKGGDPFVFGRGGEEALHLTEQGIPFIIIPGVTAGIAGPGYAGIPVTHRGRAGHVVFVTGHESAGPEASEVPWAELARLSRGTLVGYMGVGQLPAIIEKLIAAGLPPQTPAAVVERATFGVQRTVTAPAAELPARVAEAGIKPPALFVIGEVVSLREHLSWFEDLPLFGKRVMITRPVEHCAEVSRRLRDLGAEVLILPVLYFKPEYDRRAWARIRTHTRPGDWLFFVDRDSVNHFLETWRQQGKDIRALAVFSVAAAGTDTVETLAAAGIYPDLSVPEPVAAGLAEEMAGQLELPGRRVVLIRGNMGDTGGDAVLEAAGATVLPLTAYRTMTAKWDEDDFGQLKRYPPDIIFIANETAAAALVEILGRQEAESLSAKVACVSASPATTAAAHALGLTISVESRVASPEGMIQALLQGVPEAE